MRRGLKSLVHFGQNHQRRGLGPPVIREKRHITSQVRYFVVRIRPGQPPEYLSVRSWVKTAKQAERFVQHDADQKVGHLRKERPTPTITYRRIAAG